MSKIGKIPIEIKEGVSVTQDKNVINVTGPKGTLTYTLPEGIEIKQEEGKIRVFATDPNNPQTSALYGLTRATIANMVQGVSTGFEKKLELTGVGYRAQVMGNDLALSVGYSHQIKIPAPVGISFKVADNMIIVSGYDKGLIGNIAAQIRMVRPPEPYKGKGIRYTGERIRRKAGKAVGGK